MEIGYTGQFVEMLKVMENSDDPPMKFLAEEIKKYLRSSKKQFKCSDFVPYSRY